jgi:hypothetical protein
MVIIAALLSSGYGFGSHYPHIKLLKAAFWNNSTGLLLEADFPRSLRISFTEPIDRQNKNASHPGLDLLWGSGGLGSV